MYEFAQLDEREEPRAGVVIVGEEGHGHDRAEAMVFAVQRNSPLRGAYAIVISFFDSAGALMKTVRHESEVFVGKSGHEVALLGVKAAFLLVDPALSMTVKCSHRRADQHLHVLADMKDSRWRCLGGTRSKHLDLLKDIFEVKSSRANVDFVTPRARKTGPYALAKSLANGVVDAKRG